MGRLTTVHSLHRTPTSVYAGTDHQLVSFSFAPNLPNPLVFSGVVSDKLPSPLLSLT